MPTNQINRQMQNSMEVNRSFEIRPLAKWVECSSMARETGVQSQVVIPKNKKNATWRHYAKHSAL